jgi:hypothetical protein
MSIMNNLNRPRPEDWLKGSLFSFIEECWSNSVAVIGNKNVTGARLAAIDAVFDEAHRNLKPSDITQLVPSLLMLRSLSAFRASVMVGLSLPSDSFPLQRSCLENAKYARLIATSIELSAHWLKRDQDPQAKNRFSNRAVREAVASKDGTLAAIYQDLYERSIDFGAHPNEKSVVNAIIKESLGTGTLQFRLLGGDTLELDHALRSCAQVGICALKVLNPVFETQFETINFSHKIALVSAPF